VRGPGEAGFTTLTPRQRLSTTASAAPASPSQGMACPHDHFEEQWIGTGSDGLLVSTNNWVALEGWSDNYIGVAGIQSPSGFAWPSGHQDGVFGHSSSGHGVYGETAGDWSYHSGVYGKATNDHANGVTGWNDSGGVGVYARSLTGPALYATHVGVDTLGEYAAYVYSEKGTGIMAQSDEEFGWAGEFLYNVWVHGELYEGSAGFKIDHPLDPENKYLYHSSVQSPEMKNVYDGVVVLDADGTAWVEFPTWFEALNKDFRYQFTPIGAPAPNLYVAQEIKDNRFQIAGGTPGLKVSWQVTGVRRDAYAEAHRVAVEEDKPAEEQGTYLHPTEHGQPESSGLRFGVGREWVQPPAGGE
jgi:hypothetical protein